MFRVDQALAVRAAKGRWPCFFQLLPKNILESWVTDPYGNAKYRERAAIQLHGYIHDKRMANYDGFTKAAGNRRPIEAKSTDAPECGMVEGSYTFEVSRQKLIGYERDNPLIIFSAFSLGTLIYSIEFDYEGSSLQMFLCTKTPEKGAKKIGISPKDWGISMPNARFICFDLFRLGDLSHAHGEVIRERFHQALSKMM